MTESLPSVAPSIVSGQEYFHDDRLPAAKGAAFDFCASARGCLPGTRVDLLNQVSRWAAADVGIDVNADCDESDDKAKAIFWLNGMAGTGKSTIARTVAARLLQGQAPPQCLAATFFFSRSETDRRKAGLFFGTIAGQLADGSPAYRDALLSALDHDPEISRRALREQWEKLILLPLTVANETRTAVLVIDALDECESEDDVSTIIRLLAEANGPGHCPVQIKTFFTSRPEWPAELGFKQIQGQYENIILHAVPNDAISSDLSAFLTHELRRIREEHNETAEARLSKEWPGEDKIQALVSMASPLFIYADTIVRFIQDQEISNPSEQLSKLLKEGGQASKSPLDGVYLPVLNQLLVGVGKEDVETAIQEFREVIGSLVLLSEPLTAKSLAALLGKEKAKINETLFHLRSVLETPGPFEPTRILHLSFRDYLVDPANKDENLFWIDEAACHIELATQCFQLLIIKLRKDICDQSNPAVKRTTILTGTINAQIPDQIRYACLYWVYHLEQGTAAGAHLTQDQIGWVRKFLEIHFLHWIEVLCLLGLGYESISMIYTLCRLMPIGEAFLDFLHDIRRFLLKFIPITNQYPLQLYSSALFFSPRNSRVRKSFYHKSSGWLPPIFVREEWGACTQTLEGHTGVVSTVAISNGNDLIATASHDGNIKLWDRIGFCKQTLRGHTDRVYSISFSSDNSRLASASADGTVRVWDKDGICIQTLAEHEDAVRSVSFSDDDMYLASASSDKTIKIWDRKGECSKTLTGHRDEVVSVAFAHREFCLVSADSEGQVRVWDKIWDPKGPSEQVFTGHKDWVTSVVFSHNDRFIASASLDGSIRVWTRTGACYITIAARPGSSISFSPDDSLIACGSSWDGSVNLWNINTGHCDLSFTGHTDPVTDVAISSDNNWLVSASRDKSLKVWDYTRNSGGKTSKVEDTSNNIHLSITLKLWHRITGECVQDFQQTPDEHWLSSTRTKVIDKVKLKQWRGRDSLPPNPSLAVRSIVFSHDDRFIATGLDDGYVRIWDVGKGKCIRTLKSGEGYITSLDFSHDGQRLVASSLSGGMTIWSLTTGEVLSSFEKRSDPFCYIAFSQDDKYIASASYDNWRTVKVWKCEDRSCTFESHSANAEIVAFSADGSCLASASKEGSIQIWNLKTKKCAHSFQAKGEVFGISSVGSGFSIDTAAGTIVFGASQDMAEGKDLEVPGPIGYGITSQGDWITWCEDNVLWLPPEHRPQVFRAAGPTVTIGCTSGQFLILNFRRSSRSRAFDSKSVDATRRSLSTGRLSLSASRRSSSHRRDKSQSSVHRDLFW
ncbi:unnamed protein product [Clonostachys rosea f. rosea IK726]|uniref:Uncharacterized protein n=1 Tax=Clonostachys rosea f. rosea IK726 TaxID=1349383 RepID=A0ACA9TJI2_BIOOC|nr:unnamed protein product [Clonostachys rosea f. rosea IK726]